MKAIETCTTTNAGSTSVGRARPTKKSSSASTPAKKKAKSSTSSVAVEAKAKPSAKPKASAKKGPTATAASTAAVSTTPAKQDAAAAVHDWQRDTAILGDLIGYKIDNPAEITRTGADAVIEMARARYLKIVETAKALKLLLATWDELPQSFPGTGQATTAVAANDKPPAKPAILPAERALPRRAVIFDTETTGLIRTRQMPLDKLPEVIEFYGELVDLETAEVIESFETLIKPKKLPISDEIVRITGINTDMVKNELGFNNYVYDINKLMQQGDAVIAHNLGYDRDMLEIEYERLGKPLVLPSLQICTVNQTMSLKGYRLNLSSLHQELFGKPFAGAHRAKADVQALTRCVIELRKRGVL